MPAIDRHRRDLEVSYELPWPPPDIRQDAPKLSMLPERPPMLSM